MSSYRAAGARNPRRRPLRAEPPLPQSDPADTFEACQEWREALYDHDLELDRLDRHREPIRSVSTNVVALPARGEMARAA